MGVRNDKTTKELWCMVNKEIQEILSYLEEQIKKEEQKIKDFIKLDKIPDDLPRPPEIRALEQVKNWIKERFGD